MKILHNTNIWDFVETSVIGIPTNGFVTPKGNGVMGRGLAYQAKCRYPGVENKLGLMIANSGHIVNWIIKDPARIISIPVKPTHLQLTDDHDVEKILPRVRGSYERSQFVPGFHCRADLGIIEESLVQLKEFIKDNGIESVHIPLLGCGNGDLNPSELATILKRVNLPDEVTLIYKT